MAQVKTEAEIEKISKACRVAAEVLGELKGSVKVGVTTAELEQIADNLFRKKGLSRPSRVTGATGTIPVSL